MTNNNKFFILINSLTSKKINITEINEYETMISSISTQFIEITNEFVFSQTTGEVLLEFTENNGLLDFLDLIPQIHFSEEKKWGGDDPPTPSSFNENSEKYEFDDDEIFQCGGFFGGKCVVTYTNGEIKVHKPLKYNAQYGGRKTAEIIDALTGKVTDVFYSCKNDYNMTLLAYASKGMKFFTAVYPESSPEQIQQASFFIDNGKRHYTDYGEEVKECAKVTLRSNKLGKWRLIEWKDM